MAEVLGHKRILQSRPAETRAAQIRRSDAKGLHHPLAYIGALPICSVGIVQQVPFWPFLPLQQGILLVFLFPLSHKYTI